MPGRRNRLDDGEARNMFDEIHQRTFKDVVAYCRRRAASIDDANDATAEVYVVAWRRIDDLAATDKPVAWLLAVARGVLSNQRRSQARGRRLIDRLASRRPRFEVDPADIVLGNAAIADAYAALATLPVRDREILVLATLEGRSYEEIGTVLGQRPAVVRTRLYRARRRYIETLETSRRLDGFPGRNTHHDMDATEAEIPPEGRGGRRL